MELFKVLTIQESRTIITEHLSGVKRTVTVPLLKALGKKLAKDAVSKENIPGFDRSTMDGFAVRARDTYGASEGLPAYLDVDGEILMGQDAGSELKTGYCRKIPTGGMLPPGADAVVMLEYTEELDDKTIGVTRPVAPGENVVLKGEDVSPGAVVFRAGHIIRPQDLGLLAAMGITEVEITVPMQVGIISTGDEVVSPEQKTGPGQVRDINSYTLYGQVVVNGGEPKIYGVVRDDFKVLREIMQIVLAENDMVLISGGSSVGTRDVATDVISSLGEPGVLFHGVSVRPGKPTIGAVVDGKPVFGLPGHPVSAMVIFDLLAAPLVRTGGYSENSIGDFPLRAKITRNLRSAAGREDYIRVQLKLKDGELIAEPVLGKSGLITTMVNADGLARIPLNSEGVEAGDVVAVKLFEMTVLGVEGQ
ncbi:molybdopterin molybdotransferase MoeA [Desulfolucanica intricata]|uniref:molybdopterin molybdotransferase MoeA n=1 Tax=Desulfolucanica intricata TaxID=1285191 RepID=UPI00082F42E4|nr:gephyrin-like molybdotransferase Glp [Desulfolucanica intricata]